MLAVANAWLAIALIALIDVVKLGMLLTAVLNVSISVLRLINELLTCAILEVTSVFPLPPVSMLSTDEAKLDNLLSVFLTALDTAAMLVSADVSRLSALLIAVLFATIESVLLLISVELDTA